MSWKARRRTSNNASIEVAATSTLGHHFHIAIDNVTEMADKTVHAMVDTPFVKQDVINWMFSHEALDKLREARKYTRSMFTSHNYGLDDKVSINIDFEKTKYLTPDPLSATFMYRDEAAPLLAALDQVVTIHQQYAKVLHVLRFMDEHCSIGAMRTLWPTVMLLAPNHGDWGGELPKRYDPPRKSVAPLLPLMRETATIVATAALHGGKVASTGQRMFQFNLMKDTFVSDGVEIYSPAQTYTFHE